MSDTLKTMGKALYRKYRSKKLSEIVGQEHITTALDHALKSGRISHAYLFTGPRGTGKTSIARILAHEINELPYADEATHLDIIEIDAASNRRIDEIRDLRDKVHVAPSSAKFKVYIIDEVHMLTKEAFNALLKTLEEPPAHVIFILATTEVHKLPETIVSRTQRFTFKPVERDAVVGHLQSIAKQEGIAVDEAALNLLADHGGGSFRDSISLLDMAGNTAEKVTLEAVRAMLGIAPQEAIDALLTACTSGSPAAVSEELAALRSQGITAVHVAKQLSQTLRSQLLTSKTTLAPGIVLATLEQLLAIPASMDPETQLEIVLYGLVLQVTQGTSPTPAAHTMATPAPTVTARPAEVRHAKPKPKAGHTETKTEVEGSNPAHPANEQQSEQTMDQPAEPVGELIQDVVEAWPNALLEIKIKQNTLYGILRQAKPLWNGEHLTLAFRFAFHQRRVNDAQNRRAIIEAVKRLSGRDITIECIVDATVSSEPIAPLPEPEPEQIQDVQPAVAATPPVNLDSIANVFGGAEVLES